MTPRSKIDISENTLRNRGAVLDILLKDHTSGGNIIWATDSYSDLGKYFKPKNQIKREQITGVNGKVIQPRASKSKEEQKYRTKDKAEVFTPLKVVKQMNKAIESSLELPENHTWLDYIKATWLEITCGEGPYIASRYDPTSSSGSLVPINRRVGFLDQKLKVINKHTKSKESWLEYAEIALKSCYGYEWQGDNLLIARENILSTMDDFYKDFCKSKLKLKTTQPLSTEQLENFAEIISWNIWQMDGLKYVIPMSCPEHKRTVASNKKQLSLITESKPTKQTLLCPGCQTKDNHKHTGKYARIRDWSYKMKTIRFIDILNTGL